VSSEAFKRASRLALNAQVASAEHVCDCDRCRRFFEIAYEKTALTDDIVLNFSERLLGVPNPFFVTIQIMQELRSCPDWRKSI